MLVIEKPEAVFDLSQIQSGYLLYGKHFTWDEGKSGIVTSATEKQLTVQYHPGIGNVTNHFFVPASEAANKEWEIRWSSDMSEIYEYNLPLDGVQETEDENESGGTDL